jgi:hypothetical protein
MADKDIPVKKAVEILTKPIESDTVSVGNDADLYRSVEKALGQGIDEIARNYSVTVSQKVLGQVSEDFVKQVEQKALTLGRAYGIRRILSKRKQIMDTAFDRAMNDPKGQSVLLKLIDILMNNSGEKTRVTKKITTERKVRFEDIAKPPTDMRVDVVTKPNDYIEADYSSE